MTQPDKERAAIAARDTAWIARLRDGDESALASLVTTYAGWLADVATPVVGSPDLAQDVVQDVFMRLWDIRDTLSIQGNVAGYLYRAVCNRALNLRDHERSQQAVSVRALARDDRIPVSNAGEAAIAEAELWRVLEAALATLQPRVRDIFLMRVQADMSYAEIAETLGIGIPTARVQMSRATSALARQLASWVDPKGRLDLRGPPEPDEPV